MFKQFDKEDYKLTPEDIKIFKDNQAKSFKEITRLAKWGVAVKLKGKQKLPTKSLNKDDAKASIKKLKKT